MGSIGLDFPDPPDRSGLAAAVAAAAVDLEVVTTAPLVPIAMVLEVVEEPVEESHHPMQEQVAVQVEVVFVSLF